MDRESPFEEPMGLPQGAVVVPVPREAMVKYRGRYVADNRTIRYRQQQFLASYARRGTILGARKGAMVSRKTVEYWMEHDEIFKKRFARAEKEFTESLEDVSLQRVLAGKSDLLTMFHLKARRPDVYRDDAQVRGPMNVKINIIGGISSIPRPPQIAARIAQAEEAVEGELVEANG